MDKQMIEKMAKVLCINDNFKCNTCPSLDKCFNYNHAKKLYSAGYRKIPENAVVLTREEYEILKVKDKEKHWLETCMSIWKNAKIDTRKETVKEVCDEIIRKLETDWTDAVKAVKETAKAKGVEVE